METTFFYLGRFLKKLADDQCTSITKCSIYHINNMYIHPFTTVVDWPEIWCLMEVSTMFYICRYCVFTCDGSMHLMSGYHTCRHGGRRFSHIALHWKLYWSSIITDGMKLLITNLQGSQYIEIGFAFFSPKISVSSHFSCQNNCLLVLLYWRILTWGMKLPFEW